MPHFKKNLVILSQAALVSLFAFAPVAAVAGPFEEPLPNVTKVQPDHVISLKLVTLNETTGVIELTTRADFKLYAKGLTFNFQSDGPFPTPLDTVATPKAKNVMDPWYNEARDVHETGSRFAFSMRVLPKPSDTFLVRFEACSINACLLPTTFTIPAVLGSTGVWLRKTGGDDSSAIGQLKSSSEPAAALSPVATANIGNVPVNSMSSGEIKAPEAKGLSDLPESTKSNRSAFTSFNDKAHLKVSQYLQDRSFLLFPALFIAGLLMNLTPCVYPLIPITINVLSRFGAGAHGAAQVRRRKLLPIFYVLGIALAYALMGVVAAMTGQVFGSLLQSKAVSVAIAALMFVLGLWMIGVFSGAAIQNLAHKLPISEKHPRLGVFTMGAVSGLVAAPCTGPVLSTLLVLISQTKDPVYGFTLMIFFSFGFGSPYLVLGTLSQKMSKLPRIGYTMQIIKYVFASLMFALTAYYLKPLIGVPLNLIYREPSYSVLFNVTLISVLAFVSMKLGKSKSWNRMLRVIFVLALSQLALWLTLSLTSAFVQPEVSASSDASGKIEHEGYWMTDWNAAVEKAKAENKVLLVDAWAEWCAACLKMDATTWKEPSVIKAIQEKAVAVKVDFTHFGKLSDELTNRWELFGLPAVAFFAPGQNPLTEQPQVLYRQAVSAEDVESGFRTVMK